MQAINNQRLLIQPTGLKARKNCYYFSWSTGQEMPRHSLKTKLLNTIPIRLQSSYLKKWGDFVPSHSFQLVHRGSLRIHWRVELEQCYYFMEALRVLRLIFVVGYPIIFYAKTAAKLIIKLNKVYGK